MFYSDKDCFFYYFINVNTASILGGGTWQLVQDSPLSWSISSQVMSYDPKSCHLFIDFPQIWTKNLGMFFFFFYHIQNSIPPNFCFMSFLIFFLENRMCIFSLKLQIQGHGTHNIFYFHFINCVDNFTSLKILL